MITSPPLSSIVVGTTSVKLIAGRYVKNILSEVLFIEHMLPWIALSVLRLYDNTSFISTKASPLTLFRLNETILASLVLTDVELCAPVMTSVPVNKSESGGKVKIRSFPVES
jgi:hypothetical protein